MKNLSKMNIFQILFIIIISIQLFSINLCAIVIHDINQEVPGNANYKKSEFSSDPKTLNIFFKHAFTTIPQSQISAFRIEFDQFNDLSLELNSVFCTFVSDSADDETLIEELRMLTPETSSCIGNFTEMGMFDGIIKHDGTKKKLGIYLVSRGAIDYTARVFLRTGEKFLEVGEEKVNEDENYSLVPYTIVISKFREAASRIIFYSHTRELQMYYIENELKYPSKLFCGNILSVYTNPNLVRQKYHNANTMVLLSRNFSIPEVIGEQFKYQVKLFPSSWKLEYYVSSNPEGRTKNSPLVINMTECNEPYYIILNYNKPEKKIDLYIDQLFGKIKEMLIAPELKSQTWEEMLEQDMKYIQISDRKFTLPKDSRAHIDVYKIQCEIPSMLNLYYIDETAEIPKLDYGQVVVTTLKRNKAISLPFKSGIISPELTIEVFNPLKLPFVMVSDGQTENIIDKNQIIKSMPFSTNNPIVLKEKGGDSNTRIIIKVGYSSLNFQEISKNILYSSNLNMYAIYFPNDETKLNFTKVKLTTSGTTQDDNIKYCYGTNIGNPILPSAENCYRVSLNNPYSLLILNPFVMHKDYELGNDLNYYISIKPIGINDKITVLANFEKYDTNERNIEGFGHKVQISDSSISTILTSPSNKDDKIFTQIQQCGNNEIKFNVVNAFDPNQKIVDETTIPSGTKNYYKIFNNILLESKINFNGPAGSNIFIKHTGVYNTYNPNINQNPTITFNPLLNQLIIDSSLNNYERIKYTVLVSKQNQISQDGISLCSFAEGKKYEYYTKTVESYNLKITININFNRIGLKTGETFEAIVYQQQLFNSKMEFLSPVFTDKVGEIKSDIVTEIKEEYSDKNYTYITSTAKADEMSYYFSYLQPEIDVPVGAFSIELDQSATGEFSGVDCAFVDADETAPAMIDAVEDIIDSYNGYCIGGKSTVDGNKYNYIFKYELNNDKKPKRLVIKISNGLYANGKFNIFIRKGSHVYIEKTDFIEQKEYGRHEQYYKSVVPYIIDLSKIRDESTTDYISKILLYSQHLEMQMYYLDETNKNHAPILLFTGNIMLVYTKLSLAQQKYHTTKLILLSENLNGQEHSDLGNTFLFHTKMFKSDDQIEYFVSNNPSGRTLNYPLSIEMNICKKNNKKYYHILNYNRQEEERVLYLDLIYGKFKKARIATEITEEKWDNLITTMENIENYQHILPNKEQHIDIIEIECLSQLKIDILYNSENIEYSGLQLGDVAVKNLGPNKNTIMSINNAVSGSLFFSISVFNPNNNPNLTFKFGKASSFTIKENSLQNGILPIIPETLSVTNNGNTDSRFIFKIGYGVEANWHDEGGQISGKLYSQENKLVYKFPFGEDKYNFTNITIDVKAMRKGSSEELENIKFCYSTSMGMPIDASHENCFRTGINIPYSLTFLNPLSFSKNYNPITGFYYITFMPYYFNEYISLEIHENKYLYENRNLEGISNVLEFGEHSEIKSILSAPKLDNNKQFIHLHRCKNLGPSLMYFIKNLHTGDFISQGSIYEKESFFSIDNNYLETELISVAEPNEELYVKHMGYDNFDFKLNNYIVTFDFNSNTATIIKPITKEEFKITIFIAKRGKLEKITLCDIVKTPETKYKSFSDYSKTFISSEKSDIVDHFIDFRSFNYKEGTEFDLLVYAVQTKNTKVEFFYNMTTGIVGKIRGPTQIEGLIPGKENFATQIFIQNKTNNYLFYNFPRIPEGNVASLKIIDIEEGKGSKVTKIGCTFVRKDATDEEMISAVNDAIVNSKSVCVGQKQKNSNGFDALINAIDISNGYSKLVIEVMYGYADNDEKNNFINEKNDEVEMNITIRTSGKIVENPNYEYNENEELALMPYVLDLKKIRETEYENYVSKILIYSSSYELEMYYIHNGPPVELFSGHIMLVYTNPEIIKEKYKGATTMILLTKSLRKKTDEPFGAKFKFKVHFFDSAKTIQYYVSANETGRQLYNPTSIEMTSCDQPYYYIMNYNYPEGNRVLHIDNIFGEINTMKIATALNDDNWFEFIEHLTDIDGNEFYIEEQKKHHIDVIEVTCKVPLLLNVYYSNPNEPKISNLDQGDISIIDLPLGKSQTLKFKNGIQGDLIYSFSVVYDGELKNPAVLIKFEDDEMNVIQNGVYTKRSTKGYEEIILMNKMLSGSTSTKIIFKLGYNIENTFTKIKNDLYNLQTEDKKDNLFGYIFKIEEDTLNYTKINFTVRTSEENVKFCYTTNLGAYIEPSLQNCFRVGRANSYTLSILNPYIMYKNYYIEGTSDYYVSFKTVDKNQNITIEPNLFKYSTKIRNLEGYGQSLTIKNGIGSTILTASNKNTDILFVQIEMCSADSGASFEFKNAFYNKSLEQSGEIPPNYGTFFRNIKNINLDTELVLNGISDSKIYVKHIGIENEYSPVINQLNLKYDHASNTIHFNQPIDGENFKYTILLDKKGNLEKQNISLCSFVEQSKLAHYTKNIISDQKEIEFKFNFELDNLKEYKNSLDIYVLAEQENNGKLTFLSKIVQYEDKKGDKEDSDASSTNLLLVIIISILTALLIGGAIFVFICLRRTKKEPTKPMYSKPTSLKDIDNAQQGEKLLINSMASSQASENVQ